MNKADSLQVTLSNNHSINSKKNYRATQTPIVSLSAPEGQDVPAPQGMWQQSG